MLDRSRLSPGLRELIRRHAAEHPAADGPPDGARPLPGEAPAGTEFHIVGVHLHLQVEHGRILLGLRHPDSAFAPSTWHFLAGHCEREAAIACLVREAKEEAGLTIAPEDVELVHTVHLVDSPGAGLGSGSSSRPDPGPAPRKYWSLTGVWDGGGGSRRTARAAVRRGQCAEVVLATWPGLFDRRRSGASPPHTMPRRAARSSAGNRPVYRCRRDARASSNRATGSHRPSGTKSADTRQVLPPSQTTAKLQKRTLVSCPVSPQGRPVV
ncbi:NUDIX domain-containing protein [Streptomyces sp. B1I3]|uniref:NUDIX domain-containing protein n=1 Tax=Streptomyces sp. B1I3 TaxID=3042264 RepID=UPI0027D83229|nr:NUDIX domain-containing protein [Streptomyces sp. B1I3]